MKLKMWLVKFFIIDFSMIKTKIKLTGALAIMLGLVFVWFTSFNWQATFVTGLIIITAYILMYTDETQRQKKEKSGNDYYYND